MINGTQMGLQVKTIFKTILEEKALDNKTKFEDDMIKEKYVYSVHSDYFNFDLSALTFFCLDTFNCQNMDLSINQKK